MHVTEELLSRYDRPGPRYTSYPTALSFHAGVGGDAYAASLARLGRSGRGAALYIHLPFCRQRCTYCACNVVISPHGKMADPYLDALLAELDLVAAHTGPHVTLTQVHLGGGTPTYYEPDALRALMAKVRERFALSDEPELAVEVDPRVTTEAHLRALADEGFTRISLGVQDFDPIVQETIGRVQSVECTRGIIDHARELGMTGVNLDLIYGLPHQTPRTFTQTLERVSELDPDRLAIYGFAYVPWAHSHQKRLPVDAMPGAEGRVALLALISKMLTEAGYEHIGMDHFAKPTDPLCIARREGTLSRNFMGYTTQRSDDLIGVGMSAIGCVGHTFAQNEKKLISYIRRIERGELPTLRGVAMTMDDRLRAHIIRERMCNLCVDVTDVEERFGCDFWGTFEDAWFKLEEMEDEGLFMRNVAMLFDAYLGAKNAEVRYSRTV